MTDRAHVAAVDDHVRTELVRFVRALRRCGVSVPANAAMTAARSLVEVGLDDRSRVRTAVRVSLLTDSADFETFERWFETFWQRVTAGSAAEAYDGSVEEGPDGDRIRLADTALDDRAEGSTDDDDEDDEAGRSLAESFDVTAPADSEADGRAAAARYSPSGIARSIERRGESDAVDLGPSFEVLTRSLSGLRGTHSRPGTARVDARRALRTSVGSGGTILSIPRRERRRSAVRALFLVDVSRSVLDTLNRGFLLDFLRQACRDWRDVRVFFFDEDVREVTESLDAASARAATEALEAAETRWGGGTRIGESLARLGESAPEAVERRTVVFVISDGLEMGDETDLERQLSWIASRVKRVLWLNPLAAGDGYEPTARGMAAALPYVDGLFAFSDREDVVELARQLQRHGPGGRIGYEFDARNRYRHVD